MKECMPYLSSPFLRASPVWPRGRTRRMNDFVLFRAEFQGPDDGTTCLLRVTGCTLYRVRLNGTFVASGPARGPKGAFRIDELPLATKAGRNLLEIEVSGCCVNSFFFLKQPSFLQAEVLVAGRPVAWTGRDFQCFDLSGERVQKMPRVSFQRMFAEVYRIRPVRHALPKLPLETTPPVRYLPRRAPLPEYRMDCSYVPLRHLRRAYDADAPIRPANYIADVGVYGYEGFRTEELEYNVHAECQRYVRRVDGTMDSVLFGGRLDNSGFLCVRVRCTRPGRLVVMFSELEEEGGGVDPLRLGMVSAVVWELLEPGEYALESMEPYTFMYAEVFLDGGEGVVESLAMREFKSPWAWRRPLPTMPPDLAAICRAGRETFAANAVDCFTDCPSRERAAWLCDSFFLARAAHFLTGSSRLEGLFLENFALAPDFGDIPKGMLPMLYPGDTLQGLFIPNWGMWLVLQLQEYLARGGERRIVEALRERVLAFVEYLEAFANADGLLEHLAGWVFVEWSQANAFTQDVNYPSNMTYAAMLDAAARLYQRPELAARAACVREAIHLQSWNGEWFRDHALRQPDGRLLVLDTDITETCQYYAFFFGLASPESHPQLWQRLAEEFGPRRQDRGAWPAIWPSNAFIGNLMRLDLLNRFGRTAQMREEAVRFYRKMAEKTGTLWEHGDPHASCCHGFASYVNVLLENTASASPEGSGGRLPHDMACQSLLETYFGLPGL